MSKHCLEERYRNTSLSEKILAFDAFGARIPAFNFEGRNRIGSIVGIIATCFFYLGIGLFSVFKIARFSTGGNPLISEAVEVDFYTVDDVIDVYEIQMLGAFEVTDFYSGEAKDLPEYV